jgi:hypothetical protein
MFGRWDEEIDETSIAYSCDHFINHGMYADKNEV